MRIRPLLLVCFFLCSAVGCGGPKAPPVDTGDKKIKILATTAQVGALVEAVGGPNIALTVLIRGENDPHSYELVKGDGEKIKDADLVFYNGLGLEHGASLAKALQNAKRGISIGDLLPKEKIPDSEKVPQTRGPGS